ncbi:hypothetical protein [Microbacterium sp.]|uniref:hypothetical protein n=1 Tax=Microbacterium sp. TaxID=51671 RepID=UPI002C1C585B|nr:hypothetical protein [Microbacterium sp.]HWL78109.1 hypothetical protein [Microbacterium sp.]
MSTKHGLHFAALDGPTQSRILTSLHDCRFRDCPNTPEDVARDVLRTRAREPRRLPSWMLAHISTS